MPGHRRGWPSPGQPAGHPWSARWPPWCLYEPPGRVPHAFAAITGLLGSFSDELEPVWRIDEPSEVVSSGRALVQDPDGVVVLGQINARRISPASTWLRRYLYQQ